MSLQDDFNEAMARADAMPTQPTNVQLDLYGLFKQSQSGDVTTDKPSLANIRARAKWDAWNKRKGLSAEEAMEAYIDYVDELE